MRFVFTFIIPALLVGTIPVETVRDFSLEKLSWERALNWKIVNSWDGRDFIIEDESGCRVTKRIARNPETLYKITKHYNLAEYLENLSNKDAQ